MKKHIVWALLLTAAPLAAQQGPPPVGVVDVYGARTLTHERVRATAGILVGDSISGPVAFAAKARLLALPNVEAAGVDVVCCDEGKSIVYLGVRERGDSTLVFAPEPKGAVRLPQALLDAQRDFMTALQNAVQAGEAEESDSLGHSMMTYAPARSVQRRFQSYAAGNVPLLRNVLRNSGDSQHRALAAQVIAYAPDKTVVIPELVRAMRDPNETVRNNATRALALMASWGQRHPESGIKVPYEPFVVLLNSPIWTDRNKAAYTLMSLTESKDPALLRALHRGALPSLIDMVRWQHPGHALPAAMILGRVGNLSEEDIMKALEGDRNIVIEAARKRK